MQLVVKKRSCAHAAGVQGKEAVLNAAGSEERSCAQCNW